MTGHAVAGNALAHRVVQADADAGAVGGNTGDNLGQIDTGKDASARREGAPIVYSTGNLIVPETDFASKGDMGLFLTRTFNNYWSGVGVFGAKWQSNFDYKLSFTTSASTDSCYPKPGGVCAIAPTGTIPLWAHLPDGRRIKYLYNAAQNAWLESKPSPISKIVRNGDGTYTLTNEHAGVERYSAKGYVLSIANQQAVGWTFNYDASNYLQRVTHTSGRFVQLTWTGNQLTSVADPNGNVYVYAYLANRLGTGLNVLSTMAKPGTTPTTTAYYYEDSRYPGGLTGAGVSGGRSSTYAYDAAGNAISSNFGGSNQYGFTYTPGTGGALQVVETNPLGRQTTYKFVNGLITNTSAAAGINILAYSKSHTYDANGYNAQIADFKGNIASYTYAANGQLQQVVEAFGTPLARTTQFQWDADPTRNRLLKVIVVGDHETDYTYDTMQRLGSSTAKNLTAYGMANQARTTLYAYTTWPSGITQSMTVDGPLAGNGDAVVSNFSSSGDLTSVVNSLGQTATYSTYNGLGEPGHVVGVNGDASDYTYDAQGRVINLRTYPNGVAADTAYDYSAGRRVTTTTPDGVAHYSTFDSATGRLASMSSGGYGVLTGGAGQQVEEYSYDAIGDVTSSSDKAGSNHRQCSQWITDGEGFHECVEYTTVWVGTPNTSSSRFASYDSMGRVLAVTGNNSQNFRTSYDANSNPIKLTDSLNRVTTTTYDALNRAIKSVDAKGGITTSSYDIGNRPTQVTDPRGLITTYVYDGFGQLWAQSSPDTGTVSFVWDTAGRRTGLTRADGVVTTYAYDALSRVTSVSAGGKTQTFTFDTCTNGKGRLCGYNDAFDTHTDILTTAYTPEGWIASQSSNVSGSVFNTSYTYDSMGRVTKLTYPDGTIASYTYAGGKLSGMTYTIGGVTTNVATGLTYQPYGGASGWTYGNGLVRGINYDTDGRVTGISSTVPSSTILQSLTYQYDANNAITAQTNGVTASLTQSYGYDELARLTGVTSGSGNSTWGYDPDSNRSSQIAGATTTTYSNAATSNRLQSTTTGAPTRTFTYDANGNRITDTTGALSFHYDPFNRMDYSTKAGAGTTYHVDPLGRRIFKWNPSAAGYFTYAPDNNLLTEMNGVFQYTNYLWLGGQLVGMVRNNTIYMIHTDHLGRPEIVTNPAKAVVWRASNFAFDRTVTLDTIGGLNVGFPGQYYDLETGLWNNGFRDYDATVGRYVESDPLGLAAGINTFGYVGGNPVFNADPNGTDSIGPAWFGTYGPIFTMLRVHESWFLSFSRTAMSGGSIVATGTWGVASIGAANVGIISGNIQYNMWNWSASLATGHATTWGGEVFDIFHAQPVWRDDSAANRAISEFAQKVLDDLKQAPGAVHNLDTVTVQGSANHDGPGSRATCPYAGSGTAAFDAKFSGAYYGETTYGDLMANFGGPPPDDTTTHEK